uniref:Protein S100-A4-like n=1 Tax=Mastacembelus armatus TaxID=205130 RepID=A0A3Q3M2H7_9TELE
MASELGKAMVNFIAVFHRYSGQEGDKFKLSKAELKALLNSELGGFLGDAKDPKAIDEIMKALDMDGDGQVNFQEYICTTTGLTMACFGSYKVKMQRSESFINHCTL